jgi:biotin transport system substrate-specific component
LENDIMQTLFASSVALTSRQNLLRLTVLALLGSALLAVSAKVQVPFWPVPMTMQTLVVLLFGAHGGTRLAGATVLVYLVEGALGLPVFSTGAGLTFLVGPTGGYLVGFFISTLFVAYAFERGFGRSILGALAVFMIADAIILGLGVSWLSSIIGFQKALAVGVIPFLPAEALKIALATASLPLARGFLARRSKAD